MATTNAQIIAAEMLDRGITEDIHTFQKWKSLGYCVKKGEKSEIRFPIWKHTAKKVVNGDGETVEVGKLFLKTACFFKRSQVEKLSI